MRNDNGPESTVGEILASPGFVVDVESPRSGNGKVATQFRQSSEAGLTSGEENVLDAQTRPRGDCEGRPRPLLVRIVAFLDAAVNRRLYRAVLKRAFAVVGGILILLLAAPIIALAWLAIRLTSRGRAIFAQERIGLDGKLFVMYKLRTMHVDQENHVDMEEIAEKQANGVLYKQDCDPRVTLVGRLLRKSSMDELPQLWNVVRGDMSLIGPRPLVPYMLAPYPDIQERRSRVRPGITGLWQVYARNDNRTALGMVKYDYHYADHYSLTLDLFILLKTPFVVLGAKGAL